MTSIIVPTLNEEASIVRTLVALHELTGDKEIIVADGGSSDATCQLAAGLADKTLQVERGRGLQMHAGALVSQGSVLWFVHADTRPPVRALTEIDRALADAATAGGNFGIVFDGETRASRQLTVIYPWLRMLGLCYGDAGIFIRRSVYHELGGFRPYALFEDLDLIRRIRAHGKFVHLDCAVTSSSRRFENRSAAAVWAQWITLQVLYWSGVSPNRLAQWYRHVR